MIVQSASLLLNQRNQPSRECLYAWYPEVVSDAATTVTMAPRDIYLHRGLDKDLLQQNPQANGSTTSYNNTESHNDVLQRYKQSMAPSERAYHSAATLDEALRTPWALHYELERRPATPNLPSHSMEIPIQEEVPRRLRSAPLIRAAPPTSVLTIPEPRFVASVIPVPVNQTPPSSSSLPKPRLRASSAKARLGTAVTFSDEQTGPNRSHQHRQSRSAQRTPQHAELKFVNEVNANAYTQVYTDTIRYQAAAAPPPPPTYVYQRSASWCPGGQPAVRTTIETRPTALNPHYIRRPGVISAANPAKRTVVQDNAASRKPSKHRRRHHQHQHHRHQEKRNEPMLAITPLSYAAKLPVEIDGVRLFYDPSLTLDDPSVELRKYFIEGRLYLIKDQSYNVFENIDPAVVETYNQTISLPPRPKYYQTIPVEKLQIPKPPPEVHYNASETFFYNTIPKRAHRYVIDPNFISENLNVNKISLSKRPSTATVVHSTVNDLNRQPAAQTTVYA